MLFPIHLPWTASFVLQHLPRMSLPSLFRYHRLVLREAKLQPDKPRLVPLRIKRPLYSDIVLREPGTDLQTFDEVVVREIYESVVRSTTSCEYVLDLGANIGLTTLYLAAAFPRCHIISVEPDFGNQEVLNCNVRLLTECGRCEVVHGAVWNTNTTLSLMPPPGGIGYDAITVSQEAREPTCQVNAYTVDTLMSMHRFPRIDILKVDIEGAEAEVFRDDPDWLDRVNAITIEFHGRSRHDSRFDEIVTNRGFLVKDDKTPNTVLAYRPKHQWRL